MANKDSDRDGDGDGDGVTWTAFAILEMLLTESLQIYFENDQHVD